MHSFDRFYVVTKFILPTIEDLKLSIINFDETCEYLKEKNGCDHNSKEYILDLRVYCKKKVPYIEYYKNQISSFNHMAHDILTNEIPLVLPLFTKDKKGKRGTITLAITGFIGLAYEGISSFLHNKRHNALHKVVTVMDNKVNIR